MASKKTAEKTVAEAISLKDATRQLGRDLGLLGLLTIGRAAARTREAAGKARRVAEAAAKAAAEEMRKRDG